MITFLFSIAVIALFFILMSVRILFLKDGEFKGTCASQNPYLQKNGETTCGYCGKTINTDTECNKIILKKNI
ncbi:MAG: hypothetical protein QM536_01515 [Chitinophagaceae bacterium]|nr:hypothetical protein [Chitinophagaceae bacterium]